MASCRVEWFVLRKGNGGLYQAPTEEERSERVRGEENKINFIRLYYEKWHGHRLMSIASQFHIIHPRNHESYKSLGVVTL